MPSQVIFYSTREDMLNAKKRSGQMHQNGFRSLSTSKVNNGYEIVWNDDPLPIIVKPNINQRDLLEMLAEENGFTLT